MRRCTNRRVCSRHFFACCSRSASSQSTACLSQRHGQTKSHCPTAPAVGGHNACGEFASQARSRNPTGEPPGPVIPLRRWTWHRAQVPDFLHTVHRCAVKGERKRVKNRCLAAMIHGESSGSRDLAVCHARPENRPLRADWTSPSAKVVAPWMFFRKP